jgi:hypothetical protein
LTPIKDSIKLALELLKNIEIAKMKESKESVLTCEYLANGRVSTNVLQSQLGFKQSYL